LRKRLHRFELRFALLAMLALAVAQLGAISHAYSHDAALGSSTAHPIGISSHDVCNDCLAYAPLLAAAGASGSLPRLDPQGRIDATRARLSSLVELSPLLAFRSRAPPSTP
jgi:hypothetical protein